jgi:hypothetical protein
MRYTLRKRRARRRALLEINLIEVGSYRHAGLAAARIAASLSHRGTD